MRCQRQGRPLFPTAEVRETPVFNIFSKNLSQAGKGWQEAPLMGLGPKPCPVRPRRRRRVGKEDPGTRTSGTAGRAPQNAVGTRGAVCTHRARGTKRTAAPSNTTRNAGQTNGRTDDRRRKARAASSAPAGRGADLSGPGGFSASALGHLHDPRGPPSSAPPAGTWLASRDLSRLPRAVPSLVSNVSARCSESPRSSFSAPQTSSRRTSPARQETATSSASSAPAVRRPGKRVTLPVSGPHCGCKK